MVTMVDIAEKAGVSQATVSYVINGRQSGSRISDTTRQRILDAAAELGYHRNELARAMVTGKNRVLGFITETANIGLEFKARVLHGIQEEASTHNYLVKVFYLPPWSPLVTEEETVRRCIEWRVTALATLSIGLGLLERLHTELSRHGVPVAIGEDLAAPTHNIRISSDIDQGLSLAFHHLRSLGHQRIAFLSGTEDVPLSHTRADIFKKLMADANLPLPPEWVRFGHWWQAQANEEAVRQLLTPENGGQRPSAILCAGDPGAVVAIRTARALGLSVPQDLSVTGFGNYTFADLCDPPLTTISQPFEEIGRMMARRLLQRVEEQTASALVPSHHLLDLLPTELIIRASTAPPVH